MKKSFTKKTSTFKWLGMLMAFFVMQNASATVYTVTTTADAGAGSFRQAILDANANIGGAGPHTINISLPVNSVIQLSTAAVAGSALEISANTVTINGPVGGNVVLERITTIMRLLNITSGATLVTLNNLTFRGGDSGAQAGGGIAMSANLTMNDCIVETCTTTNHGAGINIGNSKTLTLNNSIVKNNTGTSSTSEGGGINVTNNCVILATSSIVENNTASRGGGMFLNTGPSSPTNTLEKCIIRGNSNGTNSQKGGGINLQWGKLTINNSQISGNSATANRGGGIGVNGDNSIILTVTNSTISGNTAQRGAGVYIYSGPTYNFTNCTISGNTGTNFSGGMAVESNGTLTNCTIARNICNVNNGIAGFHADNSSAPRMNYCIFAANIGQLASNKDGAGTFTSTTGGNVVGDAANTAIVFTGTTTGNIKTDDAVLAAALADNGGPVLPDGTTLKTHALLEFSPAIDIVGAAIVQPKDQRGFNRDATPDAGAFEYNSTLPVGFNNDFKASIDGSRAKLGWSVSSETDNGSFLIERSLDGITYANVTSLLSKGNGANSYLVYDNQPTSGTNYYRLSQIDINGTSKVLGVKSLKFSLASAISLSVYPNPTSDKIFVNLDNYNNSVNIILFNQSGAKVYSEKVSGGLTNYQLKLTQKLASGIYILSIKGEGLTEVKKIIVQ